MAYSRKEQLRKSLRHHESSVRVYTRKITEMEWAINKFQNELEQLRPDLIRRRRVVTNRITELVASIRKHRNKIASAEQKMIDLTAELAEE